MSQRSNPRSIPTTNHHRNPKPPNPISSSSSPNQRSSHPRLQKPPKPIKVVQRCNSEPILWKVGFVFEDDETTTTTTHDSKPPHLVLFRPQTCADIFAPESGYVSPSHLEKQTWWYKMGVGEDQISNFLSSFEAAGRYSPSPRSSSNSSWTGLDGFK